MTLSPARVLAAALGCLLLQSCATTSVPAPPAAVPVADAAPADAPRMSGNPLFPGWYADPEAHVFDGEYWIYPTFSAEYERSVFLDAFSSPDLVTWTRHPSVIDTSEVRWATRAMWAPSAIQKGGKTYLFFSANDIQGGDSVTVGGIGVAVADTPAGPFKDLLGRPLIDRFHGYAQPIDQFVFHDGDTYYLLYGGWQHANIAQLNDDFTGFVPYSDGVTFRGITPTGYVEGPVMFTRNGVYYFMWSEGEWGDETYRVAYGMSDSVFGPWERIGTVLEQAPPIATGAGHHSVIQIPGTDEWYIVYHRRPIPNESRYHRVTAIEHMVFNPDGTIRPIVITTEGVAARPLP